MSKVSQFMKSFTGRNKLRNLYQKHDIIDYFVHEDGFTSIYQRVDLRHQNLTSITQFKFKKIFGDLNLSHNLLQSLEGMPEEVKNVDLHHNDLKSLKGVHGMCGRINIHDNPNLYCLGESNGNDLFRSMYAELDYSGTPYYSICMHINIEIRISPHRQNLVHAAPSFIYYLQKNGAIDPEKKIISRSGYHKAVENLVDRYKFYPETTQFIRDIFDKFFDGHYWYLMPFEIQSLQEHRNESISNILM